MLGGNSLGAQRFQQVVEDTLKQSNDPKALAQKMRNSLHPNNNQLPAQQQTQQVQRQTKRGSNLALKLVNTELFKFAKYADDSFRKLNTKTKQFYDIHKRFTYSLVSLVRLFLNLLF